MKPLKLNELRQAIKMALINKKEQLSKVLNRLENNCSPFEPDVEYAKIAIKARNKIVILHEHEIVFLRANGNYTEFNCTDNRKYLASKNMKEFECLLNKDDFLRVHHTFLINTTFSFVYDTQTNEVVYDNDIRVPVSVRKKKLFLEKYLFGVKKYSE